MADPVYGYFYGKMTQGESMVLRNADLLPSVPLANKPDSKCITLLDYFNTTADRLVDRPFLA